MWDERYSEPGYAYGTEPNDFLVQSVTSLPLGRVLCLAEGEGRNAVYLAQQGYDVTAVDASRVGLDKALALAEQRGVDIEVVQADLSTYEIEAEAWDGVVSIFCHLPSSVRTRLYRQVVAGLRPGGVLLLEAYTPAQIAFATGGPQLPDLTVELAALRMDLAGLVFERAVEVERQVHEGRYHFGRSAVVQVIAFKPD